MLILNGIIELLLIAISTILLANFILMIMQAAWQILLTLIWLPILCIKYKSLKKGWKKYLNNIDLFIGF